MLACRRSWLAERDASDGRFQKYTVNRQAVMPDLVGQKIMLGALHELTRACEIRKHEIDMAQVPGVTSLGLVD